MDGRKGIAALVGDLVRAERRLSVLLSNEDLEELLGDGVLRTAAPGTDVCRAAGAPEGVFLVLHGRLLERAGDGQEMPAGPGDLVGTGGILDDDCGAGTVLTETPAILVQFPREVAGRVFERVPRLMQRLFERYGRRIVERTLERAPILASLDADARAALADGVSLSGYREGNEIVHSGELGDSFHVLADGLAAVRHSIDERSINLALVRPGDYFGEWSLLTGAPRAATVVALTRTVTVAIGRETFLALVQQHPSIQQRLDLEAHNRYQQSVELRARIESSDDLREHLDAIEAVIAERL